MNFSINPSAFANMAGTQLTAGNSLFTNLFSATNMVAGTSQTAAPVANTGAKAATSTELTNYASTDTNAYINYMNSEYSGIINPTSDVSALAAQNAGGQVMSGSAVDIGSLRSQYLKANFPGMSDQQIASLGAYYDQYYGAMQETFNAFAAANGTSLAGSIGTAGSAAGVYNGTGQNIGVDALLADAQSMVGLNENTDTAAINKITKKSGINCATTPWCAAWAMNMLKDHGTLDTTGCSNINYCPTIKNWGKSEGIWKESNSGYVPKPGDAILFDWQGDGEARAQHIGIVTKVENGVVYTVEGNSSNSVRNRQYTLGNGNIDGYLACSEQQR